VEANCTFVCDGIATAIATELKAHIPRHFPHRRDQRKYSIVNQINQASRSGAHSHNQTGDSRQSHGKMAKNIRPTPAASHCHTFMAGGYTRAYAIERAEEMAGNQD
jgi:hypothetical protein